MISDMRASVSIKWWSEMVIAIGPKDSISLQQCCFERQIRQIGRGAIQRYVEAT